MSLTEANTFKKVAVVMGSDSDLKTLQPAVAILDEFGISNEVRILSAHRTPKEMMDFAQMAESNGFGVIIAGAGGGCSFTWNDRIAYTPSSNRRSSQKQGAFRNRFYVFNLANALRHPSSNGCH